MPEEPHEQGFLPLLAARFGNDLTDAAWVGRELRATISAARLIEALEFCRNDPAIALRYPADLTAFDTGEEFVLVYRLASLDLGHSLLLHVRLGRDDPVAPTCKGLWKGMAWHEREVFDMFGIRFDGHRNLRRILLPEEWEGYPFRKDYVSVPSGSPRTGPQPMDPVGGSE